MTNSRTKARIEARIRERVAYCVEFELNDPRSTFITVTKAEISNDLQVAKVFYSVLGTEGERSRCQHMLEDATGFVRKQLGRVLRTRRIPRLTWIYDDSVEYQAEMEQSIADALARDRAINPSAHTDDEPTAPERKPEPDASLDAESEYEDFLEAQDEEELG